MKIGMNLLLWTGAIAEEHIPLLKQIKKWGFDGAELPMFDPKGSPWKKLASTMDDLGLERTVVSCLPGGANLISDKAAERQAGLDFLKACVDSCVELGAEMMAGPIYSPVGRLVGRGPNEKEWNWAIDGFKKLAKHAEKARVKISIEPLNRFETYFLNSLEQSSRLVDAIGSPAVGHMFDTFHANIEEKNQAKAIKAAGKRITHVHISANDRATPGEDHIDHAGAVKALKSIKYNGWLTVEAFGQALPELAAATCIWRRMAPSEEHVAKKSAKFVKSLL